ARLQAFSSVAISLLELLDQRLGNLPSQTMRYGRPASERSRKRWRFWAGPLGRNEKIDTRWATANAVEICKHAYRGCRNGSRRGVSLTNARIIIALSLPASRGAPARLFAPSSAKEIPILSTRGRKCGHHLRLVC